MDFDSVRCYEKTWSRTHNHIHSILHSLKFDLIDFVTIDEKATWVGYFQFDQNQVKFYKSQVFTASDDLTDK
jgi:hypothetical protein